jgi:hypothetical protein
MKAVGRLKTGIFERVNCLDRCSVLVRVGSLPLRRMQERYLLIPPQEPPPGMDEAEARTKAAHQLRKRGLRGLVPDEHIAH